MQNAHMAKNAALTVRLPASLKASLEARAVAKHRSLSAQVVAELEGLADTSLDKPGGEGRFLGLYSGTTVPSDSDLAEARARLWGRLPRNNGV
jgi:hypothetical protein